jgi:hypothetical protein
MLIPLLTFLVVALLCYAGFLKLAARILHYLVSWPLSFVFALGALFILIVTRLVPVADLGDPQAAAIARSILGLLLMVAFGTWFFSGRARDSSGAALGPGRAVLLVALAFAVMFVLAFAVIIPARGFLTTHLAPPP